MSLTVPVADYDAFDALLQSIYAATQSDAWFKSAQESVSTGVSLRVAPGSFRVFPYNTKELVPFELAVRKLNPSVAVKMRSASVFAALKSIHPEAKSIQLDACTLIQVLPSVASLPSAEKDQCAAFIREDSTLVVWSFREEVEGVIDMVNEFEERLIKYIWRTRGTPNREETIGTPAAWSGDYASSITSGSIGIPAEKIESTEVLTTTAPAPAPARKGKWWSWKLDSPATPSEKNPENGSAEPERKLVLLGPFYAGCGVGLSAYFALSGLLNLLQEYFYDGDTTRFALVVTLPVIFCVSIVSLFYVPSSLLISSSSSLPSN